MKLDVVVPTYNRRDLLQLTVRSLLDAPAPADLEITIIVVDNNSKDDTRQVVEQMQAASSRPIVYVKETKQGLSHARNAGIMAGDGDLVGLIDDDEEVDSQWFNVVVREFSNPATQFIGGPYLASCEVPLPAWLPSGYTAVIGVNEPKPRAAFGRDFAGNLNGGNAVVRRNVFATVGMYDVRLGRSAKGLLSEEDAEFLRRLVGAEITGLHVPDLIIYHHIPASRLTRTYHRRWCYWRGISLGLADHVQREPVTYLFGVPRYRLRAALGGITSLPRNLFARMNSGVLFSRELAIWDVLGFIRGKYFFRVDRFYADQK